MKYVLYEAINNREDKPMLWLHDTDNRRVAVFFIKTAPSRIKHQLAVAPEDIIWEPEKSMLIHARLGDAKYIDSWSFQL